MTFISFLRFNDFCCLRVQKKNGDSDYQTSLKHIYLLISFYFYYPFFLNYPSREAWSETTERFSYTAYTFCFVIFLHISGVWKRLRSIFFYIKMFFRTIKYQVSPLHTFLWYIHVHMHVRVSLRSTYIWEWVGSNIPMLLYI